MRRRSIGRRSISKRGAGANGSKARAIGQSAASDSGRVSSRSGCAKNAKMQRVFGTATELEEASGKKVDDLHKHIVDEITVPCECGGTMKRIPDVLDTWFDSGSMPYGERALSVREQRKIRRGLSCTIHRRRTRSNARVVLLPARLAGAIFEKNAFQNVIVNGIMSWRKTGRKCRRS